MSSEVASNTMAHQATTPASPTRNPPNLLSLPRELRDTIFAYIACDPDEEELPFLLKKTRRPYNNMQLISTSSLILTSRQLHDEYTTVLTKQTLQPIKRLYDFTTGIPTPVRVWNCIDITVRDMDFTQLLTYLHSIPKTMLDVFKGEEPRIYVWMYAYKKMKAKNVSRWVKFVEEHGAKVRYRVWAQPECEDWRPFKLGDFEGQEFESEEDDRRVVDWLFETLPVTNGTTTLTY